MRKFHNLAGQSDAEAQMRGELYLAQIQVKESTNRDPEVNSSISGKLGDWSFNRAWYYWIASVPKTEQGIPFEQAIALNDKTYPIQGTSIMSLGEVVRVAGSACGTDPRNWAFPTRETIEKQVGVEKARLLTYGDIASLCNSGKITGPRFVDVYHIDDQIGLNMFAELVRSLKTT